MSNPLVETLTAGRFCHVVEVVASRLKSEAQILEVASRLATVPEIAAGSITSYAGGRPGQDSVLVGTAVRAHGLTPNIHLTCVHQDRRALRQTLATLRELELFNVFALTGDFPKEERAKPVFDLDSVQLVRLIADEREQHAAPFHVAVAVSPFKYEREECLYQYLKLEKKIAAGANLAITQVGWDAGKFVELKRYLDERGLSIPLLGSVYVLGRRTAERMAGGDPPGCWASPELVDQVRKECEAPDGGLQARLERAARTMAILKGLGYAGAYIGGTHDAQQITTIIGRAAELESRWQELLAELRFGRPTGFYLYGTPAPRRRRLPVIPAALDTLGRLMPVTRDTWLRRRLRSIFAWIDRRPALARAVERLEYAVKHPVFGCQNCGNCVLGHMEYVCPQTCPKQMRNGPCGGTFRSRCEVLDQECIWVGVYQRAEAAKRICALKTFIPAPNRRLQGTSSWINYFLGYDSRPATSHASDQQCPSGTTDATPATR